MSWYLAVVPHERMKRNHVYYLEDTAYVAVKVEKGFLEPAAEPDWHKTLPADKRLDKEY